MEQEQVDYALNKVFEHLKKHTLENFDKMYSDIFNK